MRIAGHVNRDSQVRENVKGSQSRLVRVVPDEVRRPPPPSRPLSVDIDELIVVLEDVISDSAERRAEDAPLVRIGDEVVVDRIDEVVADDLVRARVALPAPSILRVVPLAVGRAVSSTPTLMKDRAGKPGIEVIDSRRMMACMPVRALLRASTAPVTLKRNDSAATYIAVQRPSLSSRRADSTRDRRPLAVANLPSAPSGCGGPVPARRTRETCPRGSSARTARVNSPAESRSTRTRRRSRFRSLDRAEASASPRSTDGSGRSDSGGRRPAPCRSTRWRWISSARTVTSATGSVTPVRADGRELRLIDGPLDGYSALGEATELVGGVERSDLLRIRRTRLLGGGQRADRDDQRHEDGSPNHAAIVAPGAIRGGRSGPCGRIARCSRARSGSRS